MYVAKNTEGKPEEKNGEEIHSRGGKKERRMND